MAEGVKSSDIESGMGYNNPWLSLGTKTVESIADFFLIDKKTDAALALATQQSKLSSGNGQMQSQGLLMGLAAAGVLILLVLVGLRLSK